MTTTFGTDLVGKTNQAKVNACKARLDQAIKAAEDLESSVRWLVRERAWEVLGYSNLSEMWEAHAGFKCPTHVQAVAAAALAAEGMNTRVGKTLTAAGPNGHTNVAAAEMIGLPVHSGGPNPHSPALSAIRTQLNHGVPPEKITKNGGATMRAAIDKHGTRSREYARKRAQPRRMGAAPDDLVHASLYVSRRDEDAIAAIAREANVPKAEIYRQAVAEYLMRHRESRPGAAS